MPWTGLVFGVSGRGLCRVGAFKVFARYMLDVFIVANSDKEKIRLTQTANAEKQQPGKDSDH